MPRDSTPGLFDRPKTKECSTCETMKPVADFYRDRSGSGGYRSKCKACTLATVKRYCTTEAGREKRRLWAASTKGRAKQRRFYRSERSRKWREAWRQTEDGRKSILASSRIARQRRPAAKNAHNTLFRALRNGSIKRPDSCSRCECSPRKGVDGRILIHAHHNDYAKPLDVVWLCSQCHANLHRERGD